MAAAGSPLPPTATSTTARDSSRWAGCWTGTGTCSPGRRRTAPGAGTTTPPCARPPSTPWGTPKATSAPGRWWPLPTSSPATTCSPGPTPPWGRATTSTSPWTPGTTTSPMRPWPAARGRWASTTTRRGRCCAWCPPPPLTPCIPPRRRRWRGTTPTTGCTSTASSPAPSRRARYTRPWCSPPPLSAYPISLTAPGPAPAPPRWGTGPSPAPTPTGSRTSPPPWPTRATGCSPCWPTSWGKTCWRSTPSGQGSPPPIGSAA